MTHSTAIRLAAASLGILLASSVPEVLAEEDPLLDEASWIWIDKDVNAIQPPLRLSEMTFTKEIRLDAPVKQATLRVTAESVYRLLINGKDVGADENWMTLDTYDAKPFLTQGANSIVVKAKTKTWFSGLFVVGRIETTDGKTVTVISDETWDCSSEVDNQVHKAERVVQGVNGGWWNNCNRLMEMPERWHRLNTELVVPHVPWAKPYGGDKVRVLILQSRMSQRDTIELMQRTDMEITSVFTDLYTFDENYGGQRAPFFPPTRGARRKDVTEAINKAISAPYDVVILSSIDDSIFYATVAEKLKAMVQAGTGLIFAAIPARKIEPTGDQKPPPPDTSYEKELTATPVAEKPAMLTTGIPFESLPAFHITEKDKDKDFRKVGTLYQFGKGRVIRLGLSGAWGVVADANDPSDLHYEYYVSFAIKAILWAAGKEPAARFRDLPAALTAEHAPNGSGELAFSVEPAVDAAKGDCAVSLAIRARQKLAPAIPVAQPGVQQAEAILKPVHEARATIKVPDAATARFALPPLPEGTYFLDVVVTKDGRTLNWGTTSLTVTSPVKVAEVKIEPAYIDVADGKAADMKATATLSAEAPADASLVFSLFDNHDRLLEVKTVPVAQGAKQAEAAFHVTTFASTLGKVRAELKAGKDTLSAVVGRFTAVRRDWDRFVFVGWSGAPTSHHGNVYLRIMASLGLDARRGVGVVPLETLEVADMVALPGYAGMPRNGVDLSPERLNQAKQATEKMAQSVIPFDPVAYYTGDEIDYGGGDEQPTRVTDYREFLKRTYGKIEALNRQWDASYTSFDEIYPLTGRELKPEEKDKFVSNKDYMEKAKTTRNYSRHVDQWVNNYRVFNEMNRIAHRIIKQYDPHARVGVDCPMWPFSTCGHDWYGHMQEFEMFAPYGREGETQPYEEARSFARPGAFLGLEYGGYLYNAFVRREQLTDVEWQHWRVWHGLLRGFTSTWWYQLTPPGSECNLSPGLLPYPTLEEYVRDLRRIRSGFYTLFSRIERDYGPVAIHYSTPCRILNPCMPDMGYERAFNDHFLMQILRNDAGYQYTYVADQQIVKGGLKGYKALLITSGMAIGAEEAKELRSFVRGGGVLIADVRPGLCDEHGRWDEKETVPSLFGLSWNKELGRKMVTGEVSGEYRGVSFKNKRLKFPADPAVRLKKATALLQVDGIPLITQNKVGKGVAICLNIPFNYYRGYPPMDHLYLYIGEPDHNQMLGNVLAAIFRAHSIERVVQADTPGGQWLWGLDVSWHPDGEAQYVGVTKKRQAKVEPNREIMVHAPRPGHVHDMLLGKYLGQASEWKVSVAPADVQVFSVLPYRVAGIEAACEKPVADRGGEIRGAVRVNTGGAKAVRHVIGLEVVRPDGQAVRYLARSLETADGRASFAVPLALNEPTGAFALSFTDIATGVKTALRVEVK